MPNLQRDTSSESRMSAILQQHLPSMFALAHEHDEASRVRLAGLLADVFLAKDAPLTLREEELVNELIDQLLQNNSASVRAELIEKFTDVSRMPRRVALSIVTDNIEVARDVLRTNPTLTDDDLIEIVDSQTSDHARSIAQRVKISEAVADALVTTGDVEVMRLVAENLGSALSPRAVTVVADSARFTEKLRAPIMQRREMTPDTAARLYWWVSQDLRRYALKRFGLEHGQLNATLAKTIDEFLGHYTLDRSNDAAMTQVADWLGERQAVSIEILPQVLRLGHYRLFNILLSRLSNLSLSLIDTITSEVGGRGLAVICRAIGVEKAVFVSMFLLSRGARGGEQIVNPRELSNALQSFDKISPNTAQDMLRSWKLDPSYFARNAKKSAGATA